MVPNLLFSPLCLSVCMCVVGGGEGGGGGGHCGVFVWGGGGGGGGVIVEQLFMCYLLISGGFSTYLRMARLGKYYTTCHCDVINPYKLACPWCEFSSRHFYNSKDLWNA